MLQFTTRSSFMVLPAEVRQEIYELCLQEPTYSVRVILNEKAKMKLQPRLRTISPQILATCKQIYAEARPILYHKNHFTFGGVGIAEGFLSRIAITNINLVENVMIFGSLDWTYQQHNRLTRCVLAMPRLKLLTVSIFVKLWMLGRRTSANTIKLATELLKLAAFFTRHHPRLRRVSQYRTSDDTVRELGFDIVEADYRLELGAALVKGSRWLGQSPHTEWDVEIDVGAELEMLKKKGRALRYVVGI